MRELDSSENMLDVQELMQRCDYLESLNPDCPSTCDDNLNPELESELASIKGILSDLAGKGGGITWRGQKYPDTLIHDSYFETYIEDYIMDAFCIPANLPGYIKIQIDQEALKLDYTSVQVQDSEYWYR